MSDETTVITDPVAEVVAPGVEPITGVGEIPTVNVGGDGPIKPTAKVVAPVVEGNPVLMRLKAILHAFENESVTVARDLAKEWHDEF